MRARFAARAPAFVNGVIARRHATVPEVLAEARASAPEAEETIAVGPPSLIDVEEPAATPAS